MPAKYTGRPEDKPLTKLEEAYCKEYILCGIKAEALRRAGSRSKQPKTDAYRMHTRPHVQERIKRLQMVRTKRLEIDADELLVRLSEELDADLADLVDPERNTIRPVHEWPLVWRRGLVQGIKVRELFDGTGKDRVKIGEEVEIRLSDRVARLRLAGDHLKVGAFRKRQVHEAGETLQALYKEIAGETIQPRDEVA